MCGILGVVAKTPVNQLLYDGLLLLQHRGQDAAGIVTSEHKMFHMHKGPGMVRDVFRTRNMRSLSGGTGIAHCRYPTAGSAFNAAEAQPFYVNSPFGIVLGHNGNLTNSGALKQEMFRQDLRHINTNSDSEVLLNVLAHELELASKGQKLDPETIFTAVANVHRRCRGAYAVVALIAGYGLLASATRSESVRWCSGAIKPTRGPSTWSLPKASRSPLSASSWCATFWPAKPFSSTRAEPSTAASARRSP